MKMMIAAGLAGVALLAGAVPSGAATMYEFASSPTSTDTQLSLGFSFTTNTAVRVTSLGYYDDGSDGFRTPHEVGIFDLAGTLLASTSLAAGTIDPLVSHFRYHAIAPLVLGAGEGFIIAATTHGGSDPWAYGSGYGGGAAIAGFTVAPSISISPNAALYTYQSDDVLRRPTDHFSNYTVYGGPNAVLGVVPEPASWTLLIAGFGLVGGALRSTRRSAVAA